MSHQELIERVAAVVGRDACLCEPDEQARYLVDWLDSYHGRTPIVVCPGSAEEVSAVVRLCYEAGVPVVPHGGNTGLVGGAVPSASGEELVLSLERLNRVLEIDATNYTMTVEAGCILQDVQEAAAEAKRYFPLSLGAEGTCQIGGNLATNAGGNAVLRFGNARDLVLGLQVVLPDGSLWNGLRGLRKSNTGYDLKHLFMGSEGTLGIITAATLKLFPARRQVETALLGLESLDSVIDFFDSTRGELDEFLSAFELIPRVGVEMALEHLPEVRDPLDEPYPFYALVQASTSQTSLQLGEVLEAWLGKSLEDGLVTNGVLATSEQHARTLWLLREGCVEAQRLAGPSVKHDVSIPISRVPEFIEKATRAIEERMPEARVVAFGHIGDGNIHFNVCAGEDQDRDAFLAEAPALSEPIYEVVAALDGSFSAEHGVGQQRREPFYTYLGDVDRDTMWRIKSALDPKQLMNPGKIFYERERCDAPDYGKDSMRRWN